MTQLIVILFALTYVGMALGRVPGLRVDRAGIAMIVAVVLVAVGAVPTGELAGAIHFPTLLLLGGLMILSARVGASGFYDAAAAWIAGQAGRPLRLLALTIAIGGVLSALLVNDIVVFAMTPLLCAGLAARNLDPRPFLFGLAAASNAGSAATLIGNPQNILIGQAGGLGFWSYVADAVVPSLVGARRLASSASPWCGARAWRRRSPTRRLRAPFRSPPGRHLRHRAGRAAGPVRHAAAARDLRAAGRRLPDREPRPADPPAARRDRPAAADPVRRRCSW